MTAARSQALVKLAPLAALFVAVCVGLVATIGTSHARTVAAQPNSTMPQAEIDPPDFIDDPLADKNFGSQRGLIESLIESAKPVKQHAALDAFVGEWSVDSSFTPAPGAKPIVSKGNASITKVIGGRFVQSRTKLAFEGVESETLTLLGFDPRHGHYTLHSIDSFATHAVDATGAYDDHTQILILRGEVFAPAPDRQEDGSSTGLPGNTYPFEIAFRFSSPDSITQTVRIQMPDQSWFDMTTLIYKRQPTATPAAKTPAPLVR